MPTSEEKQKKKEQAAKEKKAEARKKELREKLLAGGRAYQNLGKSLNLDRLMTYDQKIDHIADLLVTFGDDILEFVGYYPKLDYAQFNSGPITTIIQAYYKYVPIPDRKPGVRKSSRSSQGDQAPSILDEVQNQGAERDKQEKIGMDENLEKGVTPAQLDGIREIAKWMYRNSYDTGAVSLGDSQERFVRMILQLPARVKLLMYYMIENKRRHNPEMLDIMTSQTSYVPNLERFKDEMIASKWKSWKRVSGDYVYWNKLEETLQIARGSMPAISLMGALGPMDALDRIPDPPAAQGDVAAQAASASPADAAVADREKALRVFMQVAKKHRDLLQKKENGGTVKQEEMDMSKAYLRASLQQLADADDTLKGLPESMHAEEPMEDSGLEKAESYTETGSSIVGMGAKANSINDQADNLKKYLSWDISPIAKDLNLSAGILGSIGGVTSLVASIFGIVELCKSGAAMSGHALGEKIADIVSSFGEIVDTLTSGGYTIKNAGIVGAEAATEAGKAALASAETASGAISVATGAMSMGIGLYKEYKAIDESKTAHAARREMKGLSAEESEKADAILDLNTRITDSKAGSAALDVVSGSLQMMGGVLSLTGVGSIVGTVLSCVGTAVSLAKSIKEYFEKKKNTEATVDAYIKMDSILELVMERLKQRGMNYAEKEVRKQIRQEIIASLGFASINSFYTHITRVYAQFLYDRAFYKDGTMLTMSSPEADRKNPYVEMLKSFGVKAVFPKDENGVPQPDIDTIAGKMVI